MATAGSHVLLTFTQDDAIPAGVLKAWQDEQARWYRAHGIAPKWKRSQPERFKVAYREVAASVRRAFERQQARRMHDELDRCQGSCVLRHDEPRMILREAMHSFHGTRLWMGDFVIMPNHVHALVLPMAVEEGDAPGSESQATGSLALRAERNELEDLLGSIKKWSARNIGRWLKGQPRDVRPQVPKHKLPRFWQQESYDRIVRDAEELLAFRRYIAWNPEKARLENGEFICHAAPWLDAYAPL